MQVCSLCGQVKERKNTNNNNNNGTFMVSPGSQSFWCVQWTSMYCHYYCHDCRDCQCHCRGYFYFSIAHRTLYNSGAPLMKEFMHASLYEQVHVSARKLISQLDSISSRLQLDFFDSGGFEEFRTDRRVIMYFKSIAASIHFIKTVALRYYCPTHQQKYHCDFLQNFNWMNKSKPTNQLNIN